MEIARTLDDARAPASQLWAGSPWEREEAAYDYFTDPARDPRPSVIGPLRRLRHRRRRAGRGLAGRARVAAACRRRSATRSSTRPASVCCTWSTAASSPPSRPALRRRSVDGAPRRARRAAASTRIDFPRCRSTPRSSPHSRRSAGRSSASPSIATVDTPPARRSPSRSRSSSPRAARRRAGGSAATPRGSPPRSATASASRSSASRPGSTSSSATPTGSRARPTSAHSAPASPTRRSSARSPRVGLEHGWIRALPPLPRRRADRLLALLGLRRHDPDPHRRLRPRLRRAPRRHLSADARRSRTRSPTRRCGVLDFGPGDAAYKQQFSQREPAGARTSSSSRRPSAGGGINAIRTPILAPARARPPRARRDRAHRPRPKARWRRRLRALRSPDRRLSTPANSGGSTPKIVRNAVRDLRYGAPLGGTIRTRYAHLGAHDVGNADYDDLAILFAGVEVAARRRDRRRRLRQGPLDQLVPRAPPGNRDRRDRARPRRSAPRPRSASAATRRVDDRCAATRPSCCPPTGRSSTSSTRSTSR